MRLGFGKNGYQNIPGIHLLFSAALDVINRPLQNTVKSYGLGRFRLFIFKYRQASGEKAFQPLFKVIVAAATFIYNMTGQIIMEKSVQHMLYGDVFVPVCFCFLYRLDKGQLKFST
jgi:hypothetical protein